MASNTGTSQKTVLWILRQLVAVAVLPFTVAVVVPIWLARRDGIRFGLGASLGSLAVQACGVALLAIGVVLFLASLGRFAREGKGTLAPWDPPRRLVVRGPYRYVRNPMISGVVIVLFGEAAVLLSRPHLLWGLAFLGLNAVYIPLLEEPLLAERFGADYSEYRRHVPRLLPRWRPWKQ
jgi:protein-S-isoprenylcysteine O-methyltransferase Ste14